MTNHQDKVNKFYLKSQIKDIFTIVNMLASNIPLLFVFTMVSFLTHSHCSFQRTDWQPITSVVKNGFTVCGVDIGPVYAQPKSIHLWKYDSVNLVNDSRVVKQFACSKYGHLLQRNGDPVYLAVFLGLPNQIRLFKILDSIKLEEFNYSIIRSQYTVISTITLQQDRLFILYQQLNKTGSFIDVYDLSSQSHTPLTTITLPNNNCTDMLVDNLLNLGVYCTLSKTFILFWGKQYQFQKSTGTIINQNAICQFTWYNYNRMDYQKYQTFNDDENVDYFIESKFYVIFEGPTKGSMTCSVEVGVEKYTNLPIVALTSAKVEGEPSIFCDGRNFYYISYQNSIDSTSSPSFYADITVDQRIELALCARFSHPIWFLEDNVKFYILSSNVTYPNYYNYFIDEYSEVNVGAWFLFSLCCLVFCCTFLVLCATKKIFDVMSFFCCDPFSDEVKNGLVNQLEL